MKSEHPSLDPLAAAQRVEHHLQELGVAYELLSCDPSLADTADFCAHYGVSLQESCNLLLVKARRGPERYGACLVQADCRIDNKATRKLLETSKASFASPEETMAQTGMILGGVSVFGLPDGLPIWIDSRIQALTSCVVGGGSRSVKVRCAPDVFTAIAGAQWVEGLARPFEAATEP